AIAVGVSLTFTGLPRRGPEPCLRRIDHLARAQQDAVFGDLCVEEVSLLQMRLTADLFGKRQLSLRAQRCPSHVTIVLSKSTNIALSWIPREVEVAGH